MKKKIWVLIIVLIALAILFFWPKYCGGWQGDSTYIKCECIGTTTLFQKFGGSFWCSGIALDKYHCYNFTSTPDKKMTKTEINCPTIEIISEKLRGLFAYKGVVNPDKKDLIDSIILFGQTQLSIVDCITCSKSINNGMPLFTFDDDLRNIYSRRLRSSVQRATE